MPFIDQDDVVRKAAIKLAMSGQARAHEVADLAGVSRQGLYLHLPEGVDLVGRREAYLRRLWAKTLRELAK